MPHQFSFRIGATARCVASATIVAAILPLTAHAAALRVVQDPVTGELRAPTAVEAEAFAKAEAALRAGKHAAPAARAAGPKEIRYPDGTVETQLDEDTVMYSVASEQADGTLRLECLPTNEAKKAVKATAARKAAVSQAAKANP